MGVILRGHDTDLGRDVALNVLDKELAKNPAVVQRFIEQLDEVDRSSSNGSALPAFFSTFYRGVFNSRPAASLRPIRSSLTEMRADRQRCTALALLLVSAFGCKGSAPHVPFDTDPRYARQVVFDGLDVTIPLEADRNYLRCDGAVDDVVAHTHELLKELGLAGSDIRLSNPARYGRQMCLSFENGDVCAFLWVQNDADPEIVQGRLNHERYHALFKLQPHSIAIVNQKVEALGYRIDLQSLDEELAATTVEVLTLYALGNKFVLGTGHVMKAVELLENARRSGR